MYVILGWLLDRIFGDPVNLPHPIVYFGKAIAVFERWLNRGGARKLKGAFTAIFLIASVYFFSWLLLNFSLEI